MVQIKFWTRYFFAFLMALLTALLALCGVAVATVCSEDYMLQRMEDTDYYDNVAAILQDQYAALGLPAGIEESFFESAIDKEELYRDIHRAVDSAYGGQAYTVDKAALERALYQRFEGYADEKGAELTAETEESLRYLAKLCIEKYTAQANHTLPRTIGRYAGQAAPYLWGVIAFLAVMILLCGFMVYRLSDLPHRAIRLWNSSLLGAAVMLLVMPGWLYLSKGVEQLGITSRSLKPLLITYANDIFTSLLICGAVIVVTVLTVGLIGVHQVKKRYS